MVFLMQDAAAGRHPLNVARADDPAIAGGILVLHLAVIDDRHRLEAAMRMLAHAATLRRRLEVMRTGIVEQQERADVLAKVVVRKERADRKTVAHPVAAIVAVTAKDRLTHDHLQWRREHSPPAAIEVTAAKTRSEEHTSELQAIMRL